LPVLDRVIQGENRFRNKKKKKKKKKIKKKKKRSPLVNLAIILSIN